MRLIQYAEYWKMESDEFKPGDVLIAKVAVVLGHDNDYATYVGVDEDQPGHDIADYGDKIVLSELFHVARIGKYERL